MGDDEDALLRLWRTLMSKSRSQTSSESLTLTRVPLKLRPLDNRQTTLNASTD
jgi:hypothetical protein